MRNFFRLPVILLLCTMFCSYSGWAVTPVISVQPHDTSACIGANAYFGITVSNDTSSSNQFTYNWQVSSDGGTTWADASSAKYTNFTTANLTIINDSTLNGYKFRCVASDTMHHLYDTSLAKTLTVVLYPIAGTLTGADSLCAGSTTSFTHTGTGGVWSSTAPTIATVGASTGIIRAINRGIDTIKYSVSNICGTAVAKKFIRIDSLPAVNPFTGSSPICVGAVQTFVETSTGGIWSHSNSVADTFAIASATITARAQGFDTIKYTITDLHNCANTAWYVVRVDTTVSALPITGPTHTCIGDSIRLNNMNVLGTWVWTASNTNATVSHGGWVRGYTYGTDGMDTISYNFTNACNSVNDSFVVHIDSAYNPGTISGPSVVCAGSWIALTESIGGGFWENDSHTIAVVNSLGYVTGYSQGVTIISYLVSSGSCGYSIATHTVTVEQDAQMITGNDSVGVGHTINLYDATISGTWSSSNTAIATVNSLTGVVRGVATGTASIIYTVTNICGTTTASKVINVGTPPPAGVIYGTSLVCIGNQITLHDTLVPGGVWSVDSTIYANINSTTGVLTGLSTGGNRMIDSQRIVHVAYSVANAFGADTVRYTVIIRHTPILKVLGPNLVALGGNYYISGVPFGGTWSTSNNTVGQIVSVLDSNGVHKKSMASFVMLRRGVDTIFYHYVDPKGCGTVDSFWVVYLAPLPGAVANVNGENSSVNVFPNPSTGEFTINLINENDQQAVVTISNMVGEKVKEIMMNTNEPFKIKLDEPTGIYVLTAVTKDGIRYVTKLTINK